MEKGQIPHKNTRGRSATILAMTGGLALALVLAACSGSAKGNETGSDATPSVDSSGGVAGVSTVDAARQKLPANIRTSGVLTIGNDATVGPPFAYTDKTTNETTGSDIELAKALASALGLKPKFASVPFPSTLSALKAEKIDVAITDMGDTASRQPAADFVDYMEGAVALLVKKGNPGGITTYDALCGLDVAVEPGTENEQILRQQSARCKTNGKDQIGIQLVSGGGNINLAVLSGRVDTAAVDAAITSSLVKQQPDKFELAPGSILPVGKIGVVINKGNTDLVDAVQIGLSGLRKQGVYDAILSKFGLSDLALKEFTINGSK